MKPLKCWKGIVVKLAAAWSRCRREPAADGRDTVVLKHYQVNNCYQDKFNVVLYNYTMEARKASGNVMAEAYYEYGDHCGLWVLERWRGPAFYKEHQRSEAAKTLDALKKKKPAATADIIFIKDLELLLREGDQDIYWADPGLITIMLLIEVKPGTAACFKALNHELVLSLQNEPGVPFFQFGQFMDHASRFLVFKKFRDWALFQHHLQGPALQPVINFLQTSVQEPPFEKKYHHLIPIVAVP